MTGAAEWHGPVGDVWASEWRRTERAFAGVAAALDAAIAAVAPAAGHALDIGCGAGATSRALAAARPQLTVTGVDLSDALLAVARAQPPARANLRYRVGDALAAARELAPLDLLVSRHGVMFFPDPAAAFAVLNAAAAPAAPLVFSCFRCRAQNEWSSAVEAALGIAPPAVTGYAPGPYGFADDNWTGALLAAAGWGAATAVAIDVAWQVGGGDHPVEDALGFFARIGPSARILAQAEPPERERLRDRLRALLNTRHQAGAVTFTAAIWLWSARAGAERP